MTVKETISELRKLPEDSHLLIDNNGLYTELLSTDIHVIHKSILSTSLVDQLKLLFKEDFEYVSALKVINKEK